MEQKRTIGFRARLAEWLAAAREQTRLSERAWRGALTPFQLRFRLMYGGQALFQAPPSAWKPMFIEWLSAHGGLSPARVSFERREGECMALMEWEIGADEGLDESHPLIARAFYNACLSSIGPQSEVEPELYAEQIARRLCGMSSVAPSEEWFEGFFESESPYWSELRELTAYRLKALLEARSIGEGLGSETLRAAQGSKQRASRSL